MLSQFADDAAMCFDGVPVGPFEGRPAIAGRLARYAWAAAPEQMAGRLHLRIRDRLIAELRVTFETS
jgi:hypothetical protein